MRPTTVPSNAILLVLVGTTLAGSPIAAQDLPSPFGVDSTLVDRVVAVVGDSAILASEVAERRLAFTAAGRSLTDRQILSELVDQQLILQAAAADSTLTIPEAEIVSRVNAAMSEIRARFSNDAAFQRALDEQGMTPETLREVQRSGIQAQLTQDIYMRRQLEQAPPVAVTEAEMREFFEERRASFQSRPELLNVEQVLVPVRASDSAWTAAYNLADSLNQAIAAGADFAEVAREYSADAASAAEGGDLGWFRRGVMIREFDAVAFALRPGNRAPRPVRTDYGWHLILTERSRPGEVKARHVLIRPEIGESDRQAARARAEEIAEGVRAGQSMDRLHDGDGEIPEEYEELSLPRDQLASVPYEGYAQQLGTASEGDLLGPFQTRFGNREYFAVVRIEEVRGAGEFTFEDLRDQLRNAVSEQKMFQRVLERLRDRGYIDIRM